jgi:hypothetical protein
MYSTVNLLLRQVTQGLSALHITDVQEACFLLHTVLFLSKFIYSFGHDHNNMKCYTQIYVQLTAEYTVLMPMEKAHEMWSLYRSGKLTTVARELANYTLHSVGEQEFRWGKKGAMYEQGIAIFST